MGKQISHHKTILWKSGCLLHCMFYLYLLEIYQLFVTVSRRGESNVNSENSGSRVRSGASPSLTVFLRANFDRPNGFIGLMKLGVNFDHFEAKLASQNRFYTSLEFDSGSCILGSNPLLISTNCHQLYFFGFLCLISHAKSYAKMRIPPLKEAICVDKKA